MPPQGELTTGAGGDIITPGDTRSPAERAQERAFAGGDPETDPLRKPEGDGEHKPSKAEKDAETKAVLDSAKQQASMGQPTGDDKDAEIAALKAQLSSVDSRFDELLKALQPMIRTVEKVEGADEPPIPLNIDREFTGAMSKETKAQLKRAGIGYTTIVLEENESIPPTGLFVSVNGIAYVIKPGEEVDVPDFLVGVLDDAVMSAPITDSKTQKVLGYRNRSKYPYRKV